MINGHRKAGILASLTRRSFLLVLLAGCNGLSIRSQSPEDEESNADSDRKLVGDCTMPFGTNPIKIEAVALVTGLPNTGSDPSPSPERARLISEMQIQGVDDPNRILSLPSTDLVLIRGYLRPGIQEGDRFDIEVRVPSRSENQGLRGGWLMKTRLTELAVAGGSVRPGKLSGFAEGPILVDPSAGGDHVAKGRGRVLGGGVAVYSRTLGLLIKPNYRNVQVSSMIGGAVNRRFHTYQHGVKTGVAKPKTDQLIELIVHPRYKDNIDRYLQVIRALPLKETAEQQLSRMALLERNLVDPITSASAALKLEAIGKDAVPILKKGLESADVEVRFYAAEALAYLDDKSACGPLGEIARNQPAFRAFALAALGAMDDFEAAGALKELLTSNSAETRYGAFRALWTMNDHEPFLRDQKISPQFHYHALDVEGPSMIHFTRNARPEIVVFGSDQQFATPVSIEAGPRILINSVDREHIAVSRFAVGEADRKEIVSNSVNEVIRAVADLGGSYPDIMQALQQAKSSKTLLGRLEIEAVPKAGRSFHRGTELADDGDAQGDGVDRDVDTPKPDLFPDGDADLVEDRVKVPAEKLENGSDEDEETSPFGRVWSKMTGRK